MIGLQCMLDIYSILKNKGHEVVYSTNNNTQFENYDLLFWYHL